MTPLSIEILLHYATKADDYRGGDFSAPAVKSSMEYLLSERAIRKLGWGETNGGQIKHGITDRGRAFVNYLCELELPVCKWEMPS